MAAQVLIVATSNNKLGDSGQPTGCWVEELASPYYAWRAKGFHVTIASIKGGEIPFDPASKQGDFATPEAKDFMADSKAQDLVKHSKSVGEVLQEAEQYDAVFLPGGHGIVFDGPNNDQLKTLIETFWATNKVVSAVCHGPGGLVSAGRPDGEPIVKGRRVTGVTNSEEEAVGKSQLVPFLLEDRLKELGGLFERAEQDWAPHVVRDGNLVTGQNPSSSKGVAQEVIAAVMPSIQGPVHGKGEGFHHRSKAFVSEKHHDHSVQHPRPGMKAEDAAVPVPEQQHRSSWHQTYRPPI